MLLGHRATLLHILQNSRFLSQKKRSQILHFCDDFRKFSPRKSIVKQLDTTLVGVAHRVTANSRKFFSTNNYLQTIHNSFIVRVIFCGGSYTYVCILEVNTASTYTCCGVAPVVEQLIICGLTGNCEYRKKNWFATKNAAKVFLH